MMQGRRSAAVGGVDTAALLSSVAEQLKSPLTAIARQAELAQLLNGDADLGNIRVQADAALVLVDSYLLGLQVAAEQTTLALEPVSVSSLLTDVAYDLSRFAKSYGVELELSIGGRFEPVMSNRKGLKAALVSLGYALVEAEPAQAGTRRLTLAVHRTPQGIVAGLYGEYEKLSTDQWKRALELCGRARQPFTALTSGSGAGIFVADALMQAMESRLRVGRRLNETGFAVTLQPSHQLQLV